MRNLQSLQQERPKRNYEEFDPEGKWAVFMNFKRNGYNHGCPVHIAITDALEIVFYKRFRTMPDLLRYVPPEEYTKDFNTARRACLAAAEEHRHRV